MTKTISLADDAYDALVAVKRPEESFSDVARRLARFVAQDTLFEPDRKVAWPAGEADEWKQKIRRDRDASGTTRY